MYLSPQLHSSLRLVSRIVNSLTKKRELALHMQEHTGKYIGSENRKSRKAGFLTDKIDIILDETKNPFGFSCRYNKHILITA